MLEVAGRLHFFFLMREINFYNFCHIRPWRLTLTILISIWSSILCALWYNRIFTLVLILHSSINVPYQLTQRGSDTRFRSSVCVETIATNMLFWGHIFFSGIHLAKVKNIERFGFYSVNTLKCLFTENDAWVNERNWILKCTLEIGNLKRSGTYPTREK